MTGRVLAGMSIKQLNLALEVERLTPGQKLVLLVLANRANKNDEAWPSIESIARQSCMSRSGVKSALRGLIEQELLSKKPRHNRANVYRLTLDPESTKGSLSDLQEEQGKGHPVTDGGHSETVKRSLTNPLVVTQCPQTQKNHQVTIIEPKETAQENLNTEAWQEYIAYRREAKHPTLKAVSERKQKSRLAKFSSAVQAETVEQTIANGWQGLFPEKVEQQVRKSGSDPFYDRVRKNIALVETPNG